MLQDDAWIEICCPGLPGAARGCILKTFKKGLKPHKASPSRSAGYSFFYLVKQVKGRPGNHDSVIWWNIQETNSRTNKQFANSQIWVKTCLSTTIYCSWSLVHLLRQGRFLWATHLWGNDERQRATHDNRAGPLWIKMLVQDKLVQTLQNKAGNADRVLTLDRTIRIPLFWTTWSGARARTRPRVLPGVWAVIIAIFQARSFLTSLCFSFNCRK